MRLRSSFVLALPALLLALPACDGGKKEEPVAVAEAPAKEADKAEAKEDKAEQAKPAPAAAKPSGDSQHFGAALSGAPAMSITDLLADPKKHEGKLVRVEGMVTGVCTKRGGCGDFAITSSLVCCFDVLGKLLASLFLFV